MIRTKSFEGCEAFCSESNPNFTRASSFDSYAFSRFPKSNIHANELKSEVFDREKQIHSSSPRRNACMADFVVPPAEKKNASSFTHNARKRVFIKEEIDPFYSHDELKEKGLRSPINQCISGSPKEGDNRGIRSPLSLKPLSIIRDFEHPDNALNVGKDGELQPRGLRSPISSIRDGDNKALRSPRSLKPLVTFRDVDKGSITGPKSPLSPVGQASVREGESKMNSRSPVSNCFLSYSREEDDDFREIGPTTKFVKQNACCELCGRTFLDERVLAEHEKTSHHKSMLKKKAEASNLLHSHDQWQANHVAQTEFEQNDAVIDSSTQVRPQERFDCGHVTVPNPLECLDLRWEKVRMILSKDLSSGEADKISTLTRKISRNSEYQALVGSATAGGEPVDSEAVTMAIPTENKTELTFLKPDVVQGLRKYLTNCVSTGGAPAPWFLADPSRPDVNIRGCLLSRPSTFASLSGVLAVTTWITIIDVSHNDLKAHGVKALMDVLISSKNAIRELNLADNNLMDQRSQHISAEHDRLHIRSDNVIVDIGALLWAKTSLTKLNVAKNNLGDTGMFDLIKAVRASDHVVDLDLSYNAGTESKRCLMNASGPEIGRFITTTSCLKSLSLRWNTLSGAGAVDIAQSIRLNTTITKLDVGWNSFGKCRAIELLGQSLSNSGDNQCVLRELDISYNAITSHKILLFVEHLPANTSLTTLSLDGNPLTMSGIGAIRRATMLMEKFQVPPIISLDHCGAETKAAENFDVFHPSGPYTLDLSDDYDRIVLKNLVQIALEGIGEFDARTMTLNDTHFSLILPKELPIIMSVENNDGIDSNQAANNAQRLSPLRRKEIHSNGSQLIRDSNIPLRGILKFEFGEMAKPPAGGESMPSAILQALIRGLERSDLSSTSMQAVVSSFLTGQYLTAEQAVQVISSVKAMQIFGHPVVLLAIQLNGKLSDSENSGMLASALSEFEASSFSKFVGPLSFVCTFNNPTGHYCLDLTKVGEKDFATRLISWKNREAVVDQKIQAENPQVGLPSVDFDRHWRNARLNGNVHEFTPCCSMPPVGKFEIDFVQTSKPSADDVAIEDLLLDQLLDEQWRSVAMEDPDLLVKVFRELSNSYLFSCKQIQRILIEITKVVVVLTKYKAKQSILHRWTHCTLAAAFTFWRFENHSVKSFSRLICLGNDDNDPYLYKLRTEVIVTAFARIIDWHGLRPWIIDHLSVRERDELDKRLGKYNLFDKAVAVNSYTLDLSMNEDRRVMQELMHLAEIEEGRNFMDVMYNEKEFTIPAGWRKDVPAKGIVRLCFCRGPEACQRIQIKYSQRPSWPAGFREHCGVTWVATHRLKRVHERLHHTFTDAESSFKKLDTDGDGILSTTEMSIGLFKLGLWLSPPEVQALVRVLDVDGTNDIDFDEWSRFFTARRISVTEFVQGNVATGQHHRNSIINASKDIGTASGIVMQPRPPPAVVRQRSMRGNVPLQPSSSGALTANASKH